ncbi:nucleolar protein 9 [Scaptodrosophila lebanonensis]|uniref:Nucleolar protein 9 n=1 Tax=Drosophila lebanonensis TaxID=7225 RepID=A0A6J2TYK7_DROLE|nr:nucleolar protein 9 [Scaptodrosophila lebanonensis]
MGRRKKSRFFSNAKGFAKQGIYGRGTHINDETFSYFINILDAIKAGLDDPINMANNVFEQTADQELFLASNQIVSKALESLIGYVDDTHLERYFTKFGDSLRPMCSDPFASHVLQKMIEIAFLRGCGKETDTDVGASLKSAKRTATEITQNEKDFNLKTEFSSAHREQCLNFVVRIGKFVLNNMEDFVWDPCANHIIRTTLLCLVGIYVPKVAFAKGGSDLTKNSTCFAVPTDWYNLMKEFAQRLQMWPQYKEFPYQEHSSALLSVIFIALRKVDKSMLKHLGKKILREAFQEEVSNKNTNDNYNDEQNELVESNSATHHTLPKVYHHQSAIILLENMICVAGTKLLTEVYTLLFKGRIAYLSKQPNTNFTVQKLLQNISVLSEFECVFNELQPHIETLLKIGHTGVVSDVCSACLRLSCKQAQMVTALQTALHVTNNKDKGQQFFICLIKLKPSEVLSNDQSNFIHLHGSLIVQHVLQFNKPISLVNCILNLPATQLVKVFNTPNGSHIVDAFIKSKYVGEKSREKLIRVLIGFYVDFAITRHGSRVFEQCFNAAQDELKVRIIKELADKANMLKGSPYGRIIYSKYGLDTYKLSPSRWQSSFCNINDPRAKSHIN